MPRFRRHLLWVGVQAACWQEVADSDGFLRGQLVPLPCSQAPQLLSPSFAPSVSSVGVWRPEPDVREPTPPSSGLCAQSTDQEIETQKGLVWAQGSLTPGCEGTPWLTGGCSCTSPSSSTAF